MPKDGKKIAIGLGLAGVAGGIIYALTRPAKAAPPEEAASTIEIEVIGAQHSSPATVIEGETYTVRLTITNLSTSAGIPVEAALRIGIEATVLSEVLIPTQEREEHFSANQTRSFTYTMHVPPGLAGYSGSIIAAVMDPTGLTMLASASEPLVVEAATALATIEGLVTDYVNPLPNIRVLLSEYTNAEWSFLTDAYTDTHGIYRFIDIPCKKYRVYCVAYAQGYWASGKDCVAVPGINLVDFQLTPLL